MVENKKNILLVEDEALIAMNESALLRREGYEIVVAHSGEDAIEKVDADPAAFSLILMDINLGRGMDGTEAAQVILKSHDIPIIFLSSHTEPEVVARTEKITSYGYVIKNGSFAVLSASIKMAFKLHAAYQAVRQANESLSAEIEEHKHTEDALRESEERLECVLQGGQLGYWDWDIETGVVRRNVRWAEMLGYTLQEIEFTVGQWTDLHHPDDRDMAWKSIQDHLDGRTPAHHCEYRMRTKDGSYKWILDHARVVKRDADGKPVRVSGTHTNINDRHLAEEVLRKSEMQFHSVIDLTPTPFALSDRDKNVVYLNSSFIKTFGYDLADIPTIDDWWQRAYPDPEYRHSISETWQVRMAQAKADGTDFEPMEVNIFCKDGSFRTMTVSTGFVGESLLLVIFYDITERRHAENRLRESEANLREAQRLAHIGNWQWDAESDIVQWSEELYLINCRDPRYPPPTFAEMSACYTPESWARLSDAVETALQTGQAYELDLDLIRQDGMVRHTTSRGEADYDAAGRVIGLHGTVQDITERKLAENALEKNAQLLQEMERITHTGAWEFDVATGRQVWTDETYRIHDRVQGEYDPNEVEEISRFKPASQALLDAAFQKAKDKGVPYDLDLEMVTVLGNPKWVRAICNPVIKAGKVVKLRGTVQDITIRKHANDALRESEEKLKRILEILPVGVWISDATGKIVHANPAGQQIWAGARYVGPDEFHEYKAWWLPSRALITPDEWAMTRAVRKGESSMEEEIEIECFDGSHKVILNWAIPLFGVDGQVEAAISVNQDITERKKAEAALQQALADKDMLMHELQHRIKNSLMIASSLLSLEEENLQDERARAVFASTQSRIRAMSMVYEQLYRTGGLDRINLRDYLDNLVTGLSSSYVPASGSVGIETHLQDIQLDLKRAVPLGIILNELVTNSLKYAFPDGFTPQGGRGIIQVTLTRMDGRVDLSVKDNGIGIPDESRQNGGTGLNLIEILTRQLQGEFIIHDVPGCSVIVSFGSG